MKKSMAVLLITLLSLCLVAGSFLSFKLLSPEYALSKMIEDVREDGLEGLKQHLTENLQEKLEKAEGLADQAGLLGVVSSLAGSAVQDFLVSRLSAVEWSLEDVLRGKKRADVVLRFRYDDKISGTIDVSMVREGFRWRIDGFHHPQFEEFSLW